MKKILNIIILSLILIVVILVPTKANAQEAKAVGEFIKKAAQSIQELDEQLAGISI